MAILNIQKVAAFVRLTSILAIKDRLLTEMLTASQGKKEVCWLLLLFFFFLMFPETEHVADESK